MLKAFIVGLVVIIVTTGLWSVSGVATTEVITGIACTVIVTVCRVARSRVALILARG